MHMCMGGNHIALSQGSIVFYKHDSAFGYYQCNNQLRLCAIYSITTVEPVDSLYYRNLHNVDNIPQFQTIPYIYMVTLQTLYSGNLPTLNYRHRSHAPMEKKITKFQAQTNIWYCLHAGNPVT